MNTNRWIDPSQPPRLQQATQLLYVTAIFDVLNGAISGLFLFFLLAAIKAAGGYGIANEKKAGYIAACIGAVGSLLLALYLLPNSPVLGLIGVAIDAWLISLLLHDSSRGYQRIWFK